MFELKTLSEKAIPAALEKAERYRLLNEPGEAESICLDVLKIAPDHQEALVTLLLALTDRVAKGYGVSDAQAKDILGRITSEYDRAYYAGILSERRAKMKLAQGAHGAIWAYDLFREAMECYEKAEAIRPPGNEDAVLRWNTCARIIARNKLAPREEEKAEPAFD
jgi:hypothetical protein